MTFCFGFYLLQDDMPKPHKQVVECLEYFCNLHKDCNREDKCAKLYNTRDWQWKWTDKRWGAHENADAMNSGYEESNWMDATLHIGKAERISLLG